MTAKQLRKQLKKYKTCQVHVEVFSRDGSGVGSGYSHYGHLIGVSQSEPNVIVLSNRKRTP